MGIKLLPGSFESNFGVIIMSENDTAVFVP